MFIIKICTASTGNRCFCLVFTARTTIDLLEFWTMSAAVCGWVKRIMACLWLWTFPRRSKWFGTKIIRSVMFVGILNELGKWIHRILKMHSYDAGGGFKHIFYVHPYLGKIPDHMIWFKEVEATKKKQLGRLRNMWPYMTVMGLLNFGNPYEANWDLYQGFWYVMIWFIWYVPFVPKKRGQTILGMIAPLEKMTAKDGSDFFRPKTQWKTLRYRTVHLALQILWRNRMGQ